MKTERFTLDRVFEILDEYNRTNTWMFTEDMSPLHFHAPMIGMELLEAKQQIKELLDDKNKALDLLDAAGVWTGADLLVHDRVASLIRDWQEQQRKIIELQAEVGHLKHEGKPT